MKRPLAIKNKQLAEILDEGLHLLHSKILTGFNFEGKSDLIELSLVVQYYHNIEEHIKKFIGKIEEMYKNSFQQQMSYSLGRKWGIFKWNMDFDHEPGNKYYAVLAPKDSSHHFLLEKLTFFDISDRIQYELIVAKDRSLVISFNVNDGKKARFLIDSIRKYGVKYITSGIKNPDRIDDFAHAKPLFILRDDSDQVVNKQDLEEVFRLKIEKGNRHITSLIRRDQLDTILVKLKDFSCSPNIQQERRYIGKEFFESY